jgi:hypothetical protein
MLFKYRHQGKSQRNTSKLPRFRPTILQLDERILLSVTIQVDANASQHTISPIIYGLNNADAATLSYLNVPLNRFGGNADTNYNWQQDAFNTASDYYFESLPRGDGTPAKSSDQSIAATQGAGAQPILTIPTIGEVAKLGPNRSKLASFSVKKYGPQQATDPFFPDAGNGTLANGQPIVGNDPTDAYIPADAAFQQGWIQHNVNTFGTANNGGVRYYALDNEPSIWFATHRDVTPNGATMDQVLQDIISYGSMIKSVDPSAQVQGPEEWGYSGLIFSGADQQYIQEHNYQTDVLPDSMSHGNMQYFPYLLQQLNAYQQAHGVRLLDTLTTHIYPQSNEFLGGESKNLDLLRNRSTRSLWDPNYVDESWINTQVQLIPRLKDWISTYYPGTKIGITEYNWGNVDHMNGATAEADVLGIMGREGGVYMANMWDYPDYPSTANELPGYNAIKMYRNYDGNKSTFGDTSVSTTVPNPDQVSAFSAIRSADGALTIMVDNKNLYDPANPGATTTIQINLANFPNTGAAQVWQLAAINPNDLTKSAITKLGDVTIQGNILTITVPQESVTLLVVQPAAHVNPPQVLLVSPASAQVGSLVVLTGANFTGATQVTFSSGGVNVAATSFTVNSATQISVTAPPQGTLPDLVDIFVTTSQGTSAQSTSDQFTYTHAQTNPGQLQFGAGSLTAQETDDAVSINITRSDGTDGAVSISYATSDGTGKSGFDYQAASGTVTFATGETSKSISITILNPGKASGSSLVHVALSDPTGGATLGQTKVVDVSIEDSLPTEPVPQNLGPVAFFFTHSQEAYQYFVTQAYQRFLSRTPDAQGVAYWVSELQGGLTDEQLEAGFAASPEFFQVNGGTNQGLVRGMYVTLLLRQPDQAGLDYWVGQLEGGAKVSAVAFGFTASPEREIIRIMEDYVTYLGRQPDPAGLAFWLNAFLHGSTNENLVAGFVGSPEYYSTTGSHNRAAWIAQAYQAILHRPAKPGEIDYWVSVLS